MVKPEKTQQTKSLTEGTKASGGSAAATTTAADDADDDELSG